MLGVLCMAGMLRAQETKKLYVLQTSDTHSRMEPVDSHAADPHAGMGGVVRRASFVKEFRSQHPDMLLVDCGDISQGTPYYNMFRGEVEIRAMNLMNYDVMTIGNHEFDFGMENMARLFRMATFPVVCANYDFTGTPLDGLVKPYVVFERKGLRIGVFGLGARLEGLVQADKCEGVIWSDPVEAARKTVRQLREDEQCDVVICLSHLGILQGGDDAEGYDNDLVAKTAGIDLILGGHTHTFLERPAIYLNDEGQETPIMHVGKNGVYVGELELILK